jgi:phosphate transport system permease protein
MTERHSNILEYFVAPGAVETPNGSLDRPFPSLHAALEHLDGPGGGVWLHEEAARQHTLEIVCVDRPGASHHPGKRPRHAFVIDAYTPAEGDGSELAPWSSFEAAVSGLQRLADQGQLPLLSGDRLRVAHREVFTATPLETSKKRKENLAKFTFLMMALLLVLPVVLILSYLIWKAWPAMTLDFLMQNPKDRMAAGGIWAPLVGTFLLVLLSLLVAAPIGILAGVYLNEYARDNWLTRIVNLGVVNLAGVPSIVHALFGVGAFVHFAGMGKSMLAAAFTVAVMTLPVIIASSREALAAVPMAFREACWNMGATRWQTIRTIVLPNSISGILTGVILQVARAAGETAPILFTGAVFFVPLAESGPKSWVPFSLHDSFMALSYHLYIMTKQCNSVSEESQYGTAVVLIGLVLVVNSLSIALRIYLRSRKKW